MPWHEKTSKQGLRDKRGIMTSQQIQRSFSQVIWYGWSTKVGEREDALNYRGNGWDQCWLRPESMT